MSTPRDRVLELLGRGAIDAAEPERLLASMAPRDQPAGGSLLIKPFLRLGPQWTLACGALAVVSRAQRAVKGRPMRIALLFVVLNVLAGATSAAAAVPDGIWLGTLNAGGAQLRLAFHVDRSPSGTLTATMDSISQSARGMPVDQVVFTAPSKLHLEISKLRVVFDGEIRGDELVGTFTQGVALPLTLRRVQSIEPPKRPQAPKRPFPYREEELTVTVPEAYTPAPSGKVTLAGTLTLPSGKGPFPAVLLITGSGPEDRDETLFEHKPFLVLADALTRAGIATLRFDDRGTGKSGGTLKGLTTLDNASDTLAQLERLARRPEIDRRAIGLVGHSEGGLIAPIVASRSELPRFLVLLAGTGMNGFEVLRLQNAAMMRAVGMGETAIQRAQKNNDKIWRIAIDEPDPKQLETKVRAALADDPQGLKEALPQLGLVTPWLRTFLTLEPASYLKRVKVPVLALNGERDLQVDVSNLKLIEAALHAGGNRDVQIVPLPELNHLFQHAKTGAVGEYLEIEETFAPEAIAKVRDFILARARRP